MKRKHSVAKLASPPKHYVLNAETGHFKISGGTAVMFTYDEARENFNFNGRHVKLPPRDKVFFPANAAATIRDLVKGFERCLYPPADDDPDECYRLAWNVLPGKCDEIAPHLERAGIDSQPLLEIGRLLGSFPQKLSELDSQWPRVSGLLKRGAILLEGNGMGNADSAGVKPEIFTPLAFTDPTNLKTYTFVRPLLWQLWKVLYTARRRSTYEELPDQVPHWKESSITDDAFSQAVKDLRRFWRSNGREDLAKRITVCRKTVGFNRNGE